MMAAGHALGFEHADEGATSLRELAEFQFAALRGLELQKAELDQAVTLEGNLYSIWRQLSYGRLSERDRSANKLLRISAVAMDRGRTDPEVAGKVMVILLCKLYEYESSYAQNLRREIVSNMDDLPAEVREFVSVD
jgi:hypothetical protein